MTRHYTRRKGDYSGEKNNNSKLTTAQVAQVRRLHRKGYNSNQIAKKFNVDPSTIRKITNKESWSKR